MKLTEREQEICDQYGARDEDGYVHCCDCPLNLDGEPWAEAPECYATVDGRRAEARRLKRYE